MEASLELFTPLLRILLAAALAWETLALIPMVPGKLVDTRSFDTLPRWQYNSFNVFLTSLGIVSLVCTGGLIAATGNGWVWLALALSVFYLLVFLLDLMEVFPVVPDPLPTQLLVMESMCLATSAAMVVLAAALLIG